MITGDWRLVAESGVAVFCASVSYPPGLDGFDVDYFADRHAPRFAELLGDNCVRFEVHRALDVPGAPPAPFTAAAYFWVRSGEEFAATLQRHGAEIYADIARFSPAQPVRGWAEVLDGAGLSEDAGFAG